MRHYSPYSKSYIQHSYYNHVEVYDILLRFNDPIKFIHTKLTFKFFVMFLNFPYTIDVEGMEL